MNQPTISFSKQSILTTSATLRAMLAHYDDALLSWRPELGEWSIKETIGHLISADEHAFSHRITVMMENDHPALTSWDLHFYVNERLDNQRSLTDLLDELSSGRQRYAEQLSKLTEADLSRSASHPLGRFEVRDFVFEWAYHDMSHIKQIADNVRAYLFPSLTSTMQNALIDMEARENG